MKKNPYIHVYPCISIIYLNPWMISSPYWPDPHLLRPIFHEAAEPQRSAPSVLPGAPDRPASTAGAPRIESPPPAKLSAGAGGELIRWIFKHVFKGEKSELEVKLIIYCWCTYVYLYIYNIFYLYMKNKLICNLTYRRQFLRKIMVLRHHLEYWGLTTGHKNVTTQASSSSEAFKHPERWILKRSST